MLVRSEKKTCPVYQKGTDDRQLETHHKIKRNTSTCAD